MAKAYPLSIQKTKIYGKLGETYPEQDLKILQKLTQDKQARSYYEPMWREWNYAYQALFYEYSAKRKFNGEIAPEFQVRNLINTNGDLQMSDYRLPVEYAIIVRQIADEMANLPKNRWVSLTQSLGARDGKSKIFNYIYDWNYYEADGDLETFKTLLAKAIYGTAFEYIFHEYMEYPDYEPKGVSASGEVEYEKIKRIVSRCRFRNLDIRHVFMDANATDIREAEHAFIACNYGEDTFRKMYPDGDKWDTKDLKPMPINEVYASLGEQRKGTTTKVIQLLKYHDVPNNEVVYLAQGRRINKKQLHIPIPAINGKPPLPLAVFYDSPVDKEFYALGKCAILRPFREVKNKLRNAFFDISKKMAFNTLVIDPSSDFDEETFEFGQNFVRAVPDEVKPLPVSANLQPVIDLDSRTDQDMIWATGINFLDTSQGAASETATKTAIRKESQVKIVELGLKYNTIDGFKRRSLMLKQLIRLHYKAATINLVAGKEASPLVIKTPGVQLKRGRKNDYKITEERQAGFGLFTVRPKDMEDDVDLILEVGNIAATRELSKARQMEAFDQLLKLQPAPPGAQLPYDQQEAVRFIVEWGELPKEILPPGSKSIADKNPKEILKGLDLVSKPNTPDDLIAKQKAEQAALQNPQAGGAMPMPTATSAK